MQRLDNGAKTYLSPDWTGGGHISCRNIKRPGWCYASTDIYDGFKQVFAIKLDGSQTVQVYAHHRATSVASPRAVVSMDGQKIMLSSDWLLGGTIYDFVVEMPK